MPDEKNPDTSGPSPGEKAQKSLGNELNRPVKPPPTVPGHEVEKRDPSSTRLQDDEPLARRVDDEVDDL